MTTTQLPKSTVKVETPGSVEALQNVHVFMKGHLPSCEYEKLHPIEPYLADTL
jgi:hypothetical protein